MSRVPLADLASNTMAVPAGAVPVTTTVLPCSAVAEIAGTVVGAVTCTCTGRDMTVF